MPSTILGPPAVEQQDELEYDSQKGLVRTRTFRGERTAVENVLIANQLNLFPYRISANEGGLCTATVTLGGGENDDPTDPDYDPNAPISIEWTFSSNALQKTLWEHPKVVVPIENMTTEDLAALRRWIQAVIDGEFTGDSSPPIPGLNPEVDTMARKIVRGIDTFDVPQATLIQNMRLMPAATFWPNLAAIGVVYTNADLAEIFGVPLDVQAVLPQGEWLAVRVDYQRDSSGYRNTTQEWTFGKKIDDWIYPHFPQPAAEVLAAQMRGLLVKFEDWLQQRLPGLVPPAR